MTGIQFHGMASFRVKYHWAFVMAIKVSGIRVEVVPIVSKIPAEPLKRLELNELNRWNE